MHWLAFRVVVRVPTVFNRHYRHETPQYSQLVEHQISKTKVPHHGVHRARARQTFPQEVGEKE